MNTTENTNEGPYGNNEPENLESQQGSADASADDEKRKYIAQAGENPNAQETAQAVPEPVTNEAKDLQNEVALKEHLAKGASTEDEKWSRISEADNRTDIKQRQKSAVDKAHEDMKG